MTLLLVVHALFTTAGYCGLIAVNAYFLLIGASNDPAAIRAALVAWRTAARIFGPMLLLGIVLGFALAQLLHVSLTAMWLLVTYALVVVSIAVQAAIMIPWQVRSSRSLEAGTVPPMTPARIVLTSLSTVYTAIVALMLTRPG